ncbi:MBL fold metallo-hydrolase [Methanotorris igneus]|uniref:MBL fold metallo-hydrolase n=1 Tax=Methanotorris igneus TaxID=2189 RepID=UPI00064ECEFA|nr:MBL fold metallo-hydrolase [Methanotorris igneus]
MRVEIIFLGSGGGRWATITQTKATGGFRIHTEKTKLHVDPGPGALVRMRELKITPWGTNALFISHCHPDHYTDGEVIIEAMTRGMTQKNGVIISNFTVLEGFGDFENAISKYHQSKVLKRYILYPKDSAKVYDIELIATKTKHGDPYGIGARIKTKKGDIGYTGDTEYIDSLVEDFDGVRVFIANVVRKKNERIRGHLCSNDVIDLVNSMNKKPELIIMNHMGVKMTNPIKEANYIAENTETNVIPAKLGLKIELLEEGYLSYIIGQEKTV